MFFLISSENPDNKCVILGGKIYLVGRRDCDILLSGDATVSRKHAEITVSHTEANLSNVNKLPILKLKDLSKFGTWVNSQRVQGERILHDGDTVYFGSPKSSFMVVLEPLVVTSSCLDQAVKKSVKQYMVALGGHLVSEWQQDCSLLIMSKISVTIKVICALVSQKYIVLPTYLDQHIKHLHGKAEKPDPSMFTPELAETQLDSDYVSFNPDIRRKTLFTGMKFYFLSEKQMKKMRFAIELAGGIPILLERGKVDSSITQKDSVVMSCTDTELSQSDDWISRVQSTLDKKNKHMILDAEIGYAVLYCSTEKHCNPDYVADEDLSKLPSQSLSQMEQFVPNTDTQNMTQGKRVDGKLKSESNTVIDETRYNIDTQRTQTPRSSRHKQMEESTLETQSKKKERPSSPVPTPSSSRKRHRKVIEEDYDDDEFTSKRIKSEPITPSKLTTAVNVGNKKSNEHAGEKEQTKSIKPLPGKVPTKSNDDDDDEIIWGSDDDIDYTKIETDSIEEPQKKSTRQTRKTSPAPEHSRTKSNVTESPKKSTRQTRRTSPAPDNTGSKSRNVESPKKTTRQSRKTSPASDHAEASGSKSGHGRSRSRSPFSPKAKIKSEPISSPSPGSSKSKIVSHADVDSQDESTGKKTGRGKHRAHVEEQNEPEDIKPVVLPTTSNNPPVSEVPGFLSTRHPVKTLTHSITDKTGSNDYPFLLAHLPHGVIGRKLTEGDSFTINGLDDSSLEETIVKSGGENVLGESLPEITDTMPEKKKTFNCELCNYETDLKCNFKRHIKTHEPKESKSINVYICELGKRVFTSKYGLSCHSKSVHLKTFKYTCEVCSKGFNQSAAFKGHMASHSDTLKEKCQYCTLTFQYKSSLKEHISIVHNLKEKLKCKDETCSSEFSTKCALNEHYRAVHEHKDYKCQECGKAFKWRSSLKNHKDTTHKLDHSFPMETIIKTREINELDKSFPMETINKSAVKNEQDYSFPDETIIKTEKIDMLDYSFPDENIIKSAERNEQDYSFPGKIIVKSAEMNEQGYSFPAETIIETEEKNEQDYSFLDETIIKTEMINELDDSFPEETTIETEKKNEQDYSFLDETIIKTEKIDELDDSFPDETLNKTEEKNCLYNGFGEETVIKSEEKNELDKSFPEETDTTPKVKKTYYCGICSYETTLKSNFKRHEKTHEPKESKSFNVYICGLCKRVFTSKYGLSCHSKSVHLKTFKYTCEVCSKGFNQSTAFKGHMASHSDTLKEKCQYCTLTFQYKSSLKEHISIVHNLNEKLKCKDESCSSEFSTKCALNEHYRAVHEHKNYQCQECGKAFKWRSSLKNHKDTTHKLDHSFPEETIVKSAERNEQGYSFLEETINKSAEKNEQDDSFTDESIIKTEKIDELDCSFPDETIMKTEKINELDDSFPDETIVKSAERNEQGYNFLDETIIKTENINELDDSFADETIIKTEKMDELDYSFPEETIIKSEKINELDYSFPDETIIKSADSNEQDCSFLDETIIKTEKINELDDSFPEETIIKSAEKNEQDYSFPDETIIKTEKINELDDSFPDETINKSAEKNEQDYSFPDETIIKTEKINELDDSFPDETINKSAEKNEQDFSFPDETIIKTEKINELDDSLPDETINKSAEKNEQDYSFPDETLNKTEEKSLLYDSFAKETVIKSEEKIELNFRFTEETDNTPEKKNTFSCSICSYETTLKSNFKRHKKTHEPKESKSFNVYLCGLCKRVFTSKYGLSCHSKSVHLKTFKYTCEVCSKGFNQSAAFKGHMASHSDAVKEKCQYCTLTFQYKSSLKEHISTIHNLNEKLKCKDENCLVEFSTRRGLNEHYRAVHELKNYQCQECGKAFKWRSSLKYHEDSTHK